MKQRVTISISEDPKVGVTTKVEGVKGKGCHALTGPIEKALGTVIKDEVTSEFHQTPVVNQQHLKAGG